MHKHQRQPPQVLLTLSNEEALGELDLSPRPFVIPHHVAVPSLVCEVLHPTAHWSGALEGTAAGGAAGAGDTTPGGTPKPEEGAATPAKRESGERRRPKGARSPSGSRSPDPLRAAEGMRDHLLGAASTVATSGYSMLSGGSSSRR